MVSTPTDDPLDTELARVLHKRKRVDLPTLQSLLGEARTRRSTGMGLASILVERGLLAEQEARQLVAELSEADSTLLNTLGSKHGATVDPWQPGARVADYEILRRIGKGAMGMVFLARHLLTGGRYAIKTIGADANELLVARMLREGEAQARVDNHPNVVRIHAQGEEAGRIYLVMELASGGDLEARIRGENAPDHRRSAEIVASLARGLAHMHEVGVLHRDLKPGNVLFDEDDTPKLVDFGLARFDGANSLTRTGEIVGTPLYMAPEQALGRHDLIGPKTDVYGLGAILYRMITGALPYEGQTAIEVYHKVVSEPPPRPREKDPSISPALEAICIRAMQREPGKRYTAAGLADALEAYEKAAVEAENAPRGGTRKLIAGLAVAAVLSVTVAVGAVVTNRRPKAAPTTASAPAEPEPKGDVTAAPQPPSTPTAGSPLQWSWAPGQTRRVRFHIVGDGTFGGGGGGRGGGKVSFEFLLVFRWVATAVTPARVDLDVTVDRLAVQWKWSGGMGSDRHDFDSQRTADKKERQMVVVGKTFKIAQDPRSGKTLEAKGVAELGQMAQGDLIGWERMRYRIPPLSSEEGFVSLLDAVLHTFPDEGADVDRWSRARPLPDALGFGSFRGRRGGRGGDERMSRLRPPPIDAAKFKRLPAPPGRPGVQVTWMGRALIKRKPFEYRGWTVNTTLKRDQMGRQQVVDNMVKLAEVTDSWRGERILTAGAKRAPSSPNQGRTKVSFQVLD